MKRLFNIRHSYIFGILSFLLFSISLLIGHDEEAANHVYVLIKMGLIAASALFFLLSCRNDASESIKVQFSFLALIILIYELILIFAAGKTILYIRDYPAIFNSIVWTAASLISVIRFRKYIIGFFAEVFRDRNTRILIISSSVTALAVILLSIEPNGVRFTWDSNELYLFIYGRDYESLYDAKLLTFHNHVSIVYSYIIVLLKLFFNDIRVAFWVVNAICIVYASFGMTFLLRELMPQKRMADYILGNAIFMLSPWVCGMSTYYKYDYYIWCLFPLLIYYVSKKKWIGCFTIGAMIAFSKSSGIFTFGFVCAGILITDICLLIKSKDKETAGIKAVFKRLLCDIKYYCFISLAVVFFVFFKFAIPPETQFEDAEIYINPPHILQQLKLYSTANFLWVFVILTIICIIYVFFKSRKALPDNTRRVLAVMIIADVMYIIFVCLCNTYRIPRYMDSHITTVYIAGTVLLMCISRTALRSATMIAACAINLAASFFSFDPVSKCLFNTVNVGDHTIVDYELGDTGSLGDSVICNRDYYSFEILLNKALTYVLNTRTEDDVILFSLGDRSLTWGFSGGRYSYTSNDGKHSFEEFYDTSINGLANGYAFEYYDLPGMIPYDIRYIFARETIKDAVSESGSGTFYYIYMPTLNAGKEAEIYDNYDVSSEETFEFRGWRMNCISFRISR